MSTVSAPSPPLTLCLRVPPGLTALIVYMRPTHRPALLEPLAELGLFIHEITSDQIPDVLAAPSMTPDVIAVVGEEHPEHLKVVRELVSRLTPALLAIWPDGQDTSTVQASGAMAVISDGQAGVLTTAMAPVARLARTLRETRQIALRKPIAVFGGLNLRSDPARLETESRSVRLSAAEYAAVGLLATSLGRPVPSAALELAAREAGDSDEESDHRLAPMIARLRRKAAQLGGQAVLLSSVRGFGYVLTG